MSSPSIDEADLGTKLVSTLRDFIGKFGQPPVSTSILFEPHHECWGIYHSTKEMSRDDSPGDYEIHNAEVGAIPAPDSDYEQAEFESSLREIGERLVSSLDEELRPSRMGIELDYDRVYTFPTEETTMG